MFMMLFMILGMVLMYKVTATVKMSGIHKTGLMRFQGAEGGAIAVASYMSKYRQTNIPQDVLATSQYTATTQVLGDTMMYPLGYSTLWRGSNVKINAVSSDGKNEIETVVFVPLMPLGYGGNE